MTHDLYGLINELVEFPMAAISRHYVALSILNIFEKNGQQIRLDLVESLGSGSEGDGQSTNILRGILFPPRGE